MGGQTVHLPTRPARRGQGPPDLRNRSRVIARDTPTTPLSALEQVRQLFSKDSRADLESAAYRVAEALSHATATLQGRQRAFADKLIAALLKEVSSELQGLSGKPGPLTQPAIQPASRPDIQPASQPANHPTQGSTLSYAQAAAKPAPAQPLLAKKAPLQAPRKDKRIFFSIQNDAALKSASPWEFRRAFCAATGTQDSLFKAITRTRSGFAALAASAKASEEILSEEVKQKAINALKIADLGLRQPWSQYIIHKVPITLRDLEGDRVTISEEHINEEVKSKTGFTPVKASISKHPYRYDPTLTSWIISFTQEVRPFRLFETSALATPYAPKPKIIQCDICLGFHHSPHCQGVQRCHTCGRHAHGDCAKLSQCANCLGPHDSRSPSCPARPVIISGRLQYKTKAQRKALQAAGKKAASEAASKLPGPSQQPATQASPQPTLSTLSTPSSPPLEVEMSIDGSDPFVNAEEEVTTPRGNKAHSLADLRSASPRTRGRKRGRDVSPGPILDRRARACRATTFTFSSPPNDI